MRYKLAILLGVERYDDPEMTPVDYAANDVMTLATVLRERCGFDQVVRLCEGGDDPPTMVNILRRLRAAAQTLEPDDLLYFHGSAHGVEMDGQRFLLAQDTPADFPGNGLSIDYLLTWLGKVDALRRAIVLDICRNNPLKARGGGGHVLDTGITRDIAAIASAGPASQDAASQPTNVVLSACEPGQRAWAWDHVGHGLLSHFMIERLRADDGPIDFTDVARDVTDRFEAWNRKEPRRQQTPFFQTDGPLRTMLLREARPKTHTPKQDPGDQPDPLAQPALAEAEAEQATVSQPVSAAELREIAELRRKASEQWRGVKDTPRDPGLGGFLDQAGGAFRRMQQCFSIRRFADSRQAADELSDYCGQILDLRTRRDHAERARDKAEQARDAAQVLDIPQTHPDVWQVAEQFMQAGNRCFAACQFESSQEHWGEVVRELTRQEVLSETTTFTVPALLTLEGHEGSIQAVAFSPDGRRVITGDCEDTARLWDAESGQMLRTLDEHRGSIPSVAFSYDGRKVLTGSRDNTARLWEAESGKMLRTLEVPKGSTYPGFIAFSPDSRRVVTGRYGESARVWDAESGRLLCSSEEFGDRVLAAAVSQDGSRAITNSRDRSVRLWDTEKNQVLRTVEGVARTIVFAAFSPDGRRIITGSKDFSRGCRGRRDCPIQFWDVESGQLLWASEGHECEVLSATFSPDGRRIIIVDSVLEFQMWDAQCGQVLWPPEKKITLQSYSNAFSPDGRHVIVGDWDHSPVLYDAESGQELLTFVGHDGLINSVAFSPDGSRVVTGSVDKTAGLWDLSDLDHQVKAKSVLRNLAKEHHQ